MEIQAVIWRDMVDLTTPEDHGQGDLFSGFRDECMGVCGV